MYFCSYNSRGLNNKISFYKDFIASNKIGLIALLETHVKQESAPFVSNLVASRFQWLFNYDHHYNGRIWLGWDPELWKISDCTTHAQHISCNITSIGTGISFFASFIYASNDHLERRILWRDLLQLKSTQFSTGILPWIFTGDFNVCLNLDEISTDSVISLDMREFRDVVNSLEISDLNYSGKFFTWWDCNPHSPLHKKLDRVMVNDAWLTVFPLSRAQFLSRGLSDHSPGLIFLGHCFGRLRKPFQVFNFIIDHPEFLSKVADAWNENIRGDPWFVLSMKLKRAKAALKLLNSASGNLHDAVISARNALLAFQDTLPNTPSASLLLQESLLCSSLQKAINLEESFLRQKSRVRWLSLGDGNNSFFHKSCRSRWNSNKILLLEDDAGNSYSDPKSIAAVAVNYYKGLLGSDHPVDRVDFSFDLPKLSGVQQSSLCSDFSSQDVFNTFKKMAKNKSPGPDGLSPEFFVAAWSIIGEDVSKGILHFFNTFELPRSINSTAIALVPKCENPSRINHYRPISCCNSIYKCIAKLLAGRLKKIMASLISYNQTAFVPNRVIGDNVMLIQALCKDYHRNDGISRSAFKLDIHKAFDSLNWTFLFDALRVMCFPDKFILWIQKCISSCMISLKINGVLEGFFQCKNGLRQGDPLSPYLFVISMEVLTAFLRFKLQNDDSFSYHWRTKQLCLSHVIFADDIFVFCNGDNHSINLLLDSVMKFSEFSGLRLNKEKCLGFFCNVPDEVISSTLTKFGFSHGSLPIKYLGLPLISGRLSETICAPLVDRLCRKINSWTSQVLRYSGRLQLIKSVLQGIQGYWSMYLFLPKGVLKRIQSIFAKFLWGRDLNSSCLYKVAWDDCCCKKEEGGLGIRDLFEWNRAAILFQVWRLAQPVVSSLWLLWVHSCLLRRKHFWTAKIPYKCPWNVRKIFNHRSEAIQFISYSVKENSLFSAWHDPWLGGPPLIEKFGASFITVMDSTDIASVGSLIRLGQWSVSSSNDFRAIQFRSMLQAKSIGTNDTVQWNAEKVVNLSSIWDSIRHRGTSFLWLPLIWNKFYIPACSFISWLACRERLSTKDRMEAIHLGPVDHSCVLCRSASETTEHLFSSCPYTFLLLRDCPFELNLNWSLWRGGQFFKDNLSRLEQELAFLYLTIVIYLVWKERNSRIFGRGSMSVDHLGYSIKRMYREKLFSCTSFRKELVRNPCLSQILY